MKLSIIIPCYNVAPYVERAVRSVQEQAFGDWELILVDDGSADGTLPVLRRLEASDGRIRVIAQENSGVSAARNAGLRAARGEYVHFVDADDYLSPYGNVERWENCDVAVYGFSMHTGKKVQTFLPPRGGSSLLVRYLKGRRLHLGGFVFRRAFLEQEGICFDEQTYYSEDKEVMIKALFCARRIQPIQYALYQYIRREGSAMGTGRFAVKRLTSLYAMDRVEHFVWKRVGKNGIWQAVRLNQGVSLLIIYRLFLKSVVARDQYDEVKTLLKQNMAEIMSTGYLLGGGRYSLLFNSFRFLYRLNPTLLERVLIRL